MEKEIVDLKVEIDKFMKQNEVLKVKLFNFDRFCFKLLLISFYWIF